jgi:hypothetical protein
MEAARANAPTTVLTMDRVVSLQDYSDFALGFSGVGKAIATWTWNGSHRGVLVTIAGEDGDSNDDSGDLGRRLLREINLAGDPGVPVQVKWFRRAAFSVAAEVLVDAPTYSAERVIAAARQVLLDRFSFAARSFRQPVALSEVISAIQHVQGVVAVDVGRLQKPGGPASASMLVPETPLPGAHASSVSAAELLIIDPYSVADVKPKP